MAAIFSVPHVVPFSLQSKDPGGLRERPKSTGLWYGLMRAELLKGSCAWLSASILVGVQCTLLVLPALPVYPEGFSRPQVFRVALEVNVGVRSLQQGERRSFPL